MNYERSKRNYLIGKQYDRCSEGIKITTFFDRTKIPIKSIKITGNTNQYINKFKQLGGYWNKKEKAWILPYDVKDEVEELNSINDDNIINDYEKQCMTNFNIDAIKRQLKLYNYLGQLVLTGNTRGIEQILRDLNGHWSPDYYGWIFPLYKRKQLESIFGSAELNVHPLLLSNNDLLEDLED